MDALEDGGVTLLEEIDTKLRRAREALKQLHYVAENVSAKEFHDYMTGEIFSDDKIHCVMFLTVVF